MAKTCSYCAGDAVEVCSACGNPLCSDHGERALPYLSLGEMLRTIFQTLFRNPGALPALLLEPGEEEVFCADCLRINAERRVQEQRKFFYLAMVLIALCALVVYLLVRFL